MGGHKRKKFNEEAFREELRARRAKATLLINDGVILIVLVGLHVTIEKIILLATGGHAMAERILSALTFLAILPCYVSNCWEMVLLFWPSFKKRPGGDE